MTVSTLPILPTSVVGSYAIPAWLWAAWEKIEAGGFGAMDVAETENDAVAIAVRDQEHAGLDLISDGEMRRQGFIVSIFKYFHGLRPIEPRRKVGVLSYDGHVFYEPVERLSAPAGLGTLKELDHLRQGAQLSERGPGQGRHGIEGNVPDQLQPDLVAKALLDRTLEPAGNEGF